MKTFFLYCLLTLSISVFPSSLSADTVTILSDAWYPINGQPNSTHPGYMIEIAQTILETQGHQLDYRIAPWKRSILEVRKGNADCIIGAYKSDAPDFIFPDSPWGSAQFNFYIRQDSNWYYQGIASLSGMRLGVISGYSYSSELDQYIAEKKNSETVQLVAGESGLEKNIRKLLAGRIDVLVSFSPVLNRKLAELGSSMETRVKFAGNLEKKQGLYIACSPSKKSTSQYISAFSKGFIELKEKGLLKKILQKYGIKE